MTRDIINFGLRLMLVGALAAAGLGLTYGAVKENIAETEMKERVEGASKVLEAAGLSAVEDIDLLSRVQGISEDFADSMIAVFRGEDASGSLGGYAFVFEAKGYNFMTLAVGMGLDGKVIAVDVVKQEETPGIGSVPTENDDYLAQYQGMGPGALKLKVDVDAWTGATFTSNGICNGVNMALEAFEALGEGK